MRNSGFGVVSKSNMKPFVIISKKKHGLQKNFILDLGLTDCKCENLKFSSFRGTVALRSL